MTIVTGKVWTEREIKQKTISFGKNPQGVYQDNKGRWVASDKSIKIIQTTLGELFDDCFKKDVPKL